MTEDITFPIIKIRPAGEYMRSQIPDKPCTVLISFGTPYFGYDFPWISTYINAYSPGKPTQEAVLQILTGDFTVNGKSPVDLDKPYKLKKHLWGNR